MEAMTTQEAVFVGISILFLTIIVPGVAHAQPTPMAMVPTRATDLYARQQLSPSRSLPPPLGKVAASSSNSSYDEQLGMTFTQSFTSMLYYVTAVEQTDPTSGTGPAYLLNGLSSTGYWYQVGLAWNWNPGSAPGTGFDMIYTVFSPNGTVIFPSNGQYLVSFSGPVNEGDNVSLNLYFSNSGHVVMLAEDLGTGAYAYATYSAEGATYFTGSSYLPANPQGFFTGLMTEWYHTSPTYGNEQKVTYSQPSLGLSSAWMWIDEFSCSNASCSNRTTLFSNDTVNPVYYTNPTQLQEFSSNGATEFSDAYEFVTGLRLSVSIILSYSVMGGSSSFSPPTLTYVSNGELQTTTLNTSPTAYVIDTSTPWSVTNPLGGSSPNQRWDSNQRTRAVATSTQTINFVYYNQYFVSFDYRVSSQNEGTSYSPPVITYYKFSTPQTTAAESRVWADGDSSYQYQNPLPGSTSVEGWYSQSPSGNVTSPATITVSYFHQYAMTVDYSVVGGGTLAPTITSTSFGLTSAQSLLSSGQVIWLDAGSTYSLNNPVLSGATERLFTNGAMTGAASPGLVISTTYYHQYLVTWSYGVSGGGSGYFGPTLTYSYLGSNTAESLLQAGNSLWMDAGSMWSLPNHLGGSTTTERWGTNFSATGTIMSPATYNLTYYRQYLATLDYSILGGGSGYVPPMVNFTAFGHSTSAMANTTGWADAQTSYFYPQILQGSTDSQRWLVTSVASGEFTSPTSLDVRYQNQYYGVVRSAEPAGGTVSPSSGWLDAGKSVSFNATTFEGWEFQSWTGKGYGSYSGNSSETAISMDAPINETATFYPGLTISVGGGGSVSYSYSQTSGGVQGGTVKSLYVPVGTNVSLSTGPSVLVYSFGGWSGASSGKSSSLSLVVNSPLSIQAKYGYNLTLIGAVEGIVVVILLAFYFVRRRKPSRA